MIQFTAACQERTFVDHDGVNIHFYQWRAGHPRAIVQIAHGLGEYAGRYEELAQKLVSAGFTVYADDHRGHGQTGLEQWSGDHTQLGKLGAGGIGSTVESVHELTALIKEENPGLPVILLGHSWGSLIAQRLINEHSDEYAALILTGTALRTLRRMNGGDLAKKHSHLGTTGFEWLSRDISVSHAFLDDPLTFTANGLKLFGVRDSLNLLGLPGRKLPNDLPVLIQNGSEDTLGGPRSVELLAEAYLNRSRLTDVELIIYEGARHEVFKETNREEVFADTVGWLLKRFGPGNATETPQRTAADQES